MDPWYTVRGGCVVDESEVSEVRYGLKRWDFDMWALIGRNGQISCMFRLILFLDRYNAQALFEE